MTQAGRVFHRNMRRPAAFLSLFDYPGDRSRKAGQPSAREKELLRAAVVFSIAALDAYLHDVVLELILEGSGERDALAEPLRAIAKEDPALALRVALANSDAERKAEFRKALDAWLSTKSFQGPEAVVRALTYVGQPVSAADLNPRLGEKWAAELTDWTEKRHGMVHRAENPYVRRAHAQSCVDLVERVVATVEDLLAEE